MPRRLLSIAFALVVVQLLVVGCKAPPEWNTNPEQPGKACKADAECSDATCIEGHCYDATCRNHRLNGTETDIDCGGDRCPACPTFNACIQSSDCEAGNLCIEGLCYSATCKNNTLDLTETDRDCGGPSCPACSKGRACSLASDCIGGVPCTNGKCGDPLCFNLAQDETETDVDCGGTCGGCANTKACSSHGDCESLNCALGVCSPSTCTDGSRNQGEADIDCGDAAQLCPPCLKGATCVDHASCESKHCVSGVCAAPVCSDAIQNGDETGTDCGGSCKPCTQGLACLKATDCQSQVCKGGLCQPRSCSDGIKNGSETGTDCGGPCVTDLSPPQRCADGAACGTNDDCVFKNCTALVCQPPTCANGVKDPTESSIDCGGSCSPCPPLSPCITGTDCDSKICNSSTKLCDPPSCTDAVQNGNETDVNCGGVTCTTRCTAGAKCDSDSDCASKVCSPATSRCMAPTCTDSVPNGNETGPDCGGGCAMASAPQRCGPGLPCNVDNDCASNNCCTAAASCNDGDLNKCVPPICTDGKINQDETGIDCGGDKCAKRCADNQPCKSKSDCASGVCTGQICQAPTCTDGEKNGLEMGLDCGSACPLRCATGTPCKGPGDCTSLVCLKDAGGAFTVCAEPTCTDGVRNGKEACSADHGGGCPKPCPEGSACNLTADCDPAVAHIECINGTCSVPTCKDGVIGGTETDLDCGDKCGPCENLKKCKVATDCLSNRCVDDGTGVLRCAVPTCTDVTVNQGESGTDCGGTSPCDKCGTGLGCSLNADCKNGICGPDGLCAAPTCADTVQNQDETDKDCGGPNCQTATTACDDGRVCKGNADCKNAWCLMANATTGICTTPSCTDSYQNGKETDVNCGGNCPSKCLDTKHCITDTDCVNGWCNAGSCATPACTDSVKNGSESGPDCGGNCAACFTAPSSYNPSCKQCADGLGCNANGDCKSLNCVNQICAPPAASSATPSLCVGKVLEGATTTCGACTSSECLTYLWCFYASDCDPGKVGTYSNYCTSGGTPAGGGPCSVNIVKKASTALDAAIKAYRCACP